MAKKLLIAREYECSMLQDCMESGRSEFVIVYGRRRVGKTYLVEQFFEKTYDFEFVGAHKAPEKVQLHNFAKAIKKHSACDAMPKYNDWYDAFDALEEHLASQPEDRKKVVFIDEMPWIDNIRSEFVTALENFWNGWASRRDDIVLIASGSATSWMVEKLVENQGGLHARITANIYLRPFSLQETEEYLRQSGCRWDRYQILQCYMIFGGVPFYLSLLKVKESLVQNVDRLFFMQNAQMRMEYDELFNALFSNAEQYTKLARALAQHREGMTRDELAKVYGSNGNQLTKILSNLIRCDFVERVAHFGKKQNACIYRLVDCYTLFYYKFIEQDESKDTAWWSNNFDSQSVLSWMGFAYELVCLKHIQQIKKAMGISGISTSVSSWRGKNDDGEGAQIDLVIDRADRYVNLCEIKFAKGEYFLTNEYEEKLRKRMALFENATKTTKSVVTTFITTYGVHNGKGRSIVHNELELDDLFLK